MNKVAELEAFIAVVDSGSFSSAADQIGIAKSAISKRLTDLETRLGVRLLRRTTRKLSLTEQGKEFQSRVRQLLSDLAEAEQSVSAEQCALSGKLRIAAPLSFGLMHLKPVITAFMAQHPELSLEFDYNDRQVDLVEEGFNMALRIGDLKDSSLISRRLMDVTPHCIASSRYLEEWGTPRHPMELEQHNILRYSNISGSRPLKFHDQQGQSFEPRLKGNFSSNNGEQLLSVCEAGYGISIAPDFLCHQAIKSGTVNLLLRKFRLKPSGIHLVYPPGRFVSRRVRAFADYLSVHFTPDQVPWQISTDDCTPY